MIIFGCGFFINGCGLSDVWMLVDGVFDYMKDVGHNYYIINVFRGRHISFFV